MEQRQSWQELSESCVEKKRVHKGEEGKGRKCEDVVVFDLR